MKTAKKRPKNRNVKRPILITGSRLFRCTMTPALSIGLHPCHSGQRNNWKYPQKGRISVWNPSSVNVTSVTDSRSHFAILNLSVVSCDRIETLPCSHWRTSAFSLFVDVQYPAGWVGITHYYHDHREDLRYCVGLQIISEYSSKLFCCQTLWGQKMSHWSYPNLASFGNLSTNSQTIHPISRQGNTAF